MNYILITDDNKKEFESLFGGFRLAHKNRISIGAYDDKGYVCGVISYSQKDYEILIDWLYVHPEYRRQGVGRELVRQVLSAVGHTEMMPVMAQFEVEGDESKFYEFFMSIEEMDVSYVYERYKASLRSIDSKALLRQNQKRHVKKENFFDLPSFRQRAILKKAADLETGYDVDSYEEWKDSCVPELCKVVEYDDVLHAVIFVQRNRDGNLELSFLYGSTPLVLVDLLSDVVAVAEDMFADAYVIMDCISDSSERLSKKLFPDATCVHVYEAEW